ncbi:hypothetical protein VP01_2005g3 [Puccinia sorghi]|uniref:Uncharacterized protein n=1 Tax=Puccinia sorghi TaxID=27349 RepID=A0A0L6VB77_9BASI|nr:hypothetical protein VP01_2005g3 [Puccinia sorghi]
MLSSDPPDVDNLTIQASVWTIQECVLIFNDLAYDNANWITFSSTCLPSPDYLSTLQAIRNVPQVLPLQMRPADASRSICLNLTSGAGPTPTSPSCMEIPSCCSMT